MKILHKITSLLLCTLLLSTLFISGYAQGEPSLSKTYEKQSYVVVKGDAGTQNAGYDVSLMLVKNTASAIPSKEDIGYLAQTSIKADGSYLFEFYFNGFTYDENGYVNNYNLVLNVNNETITDTVSKAEIISELVVFNSLDFSEFGKAIADLTNSYSLENISYSLIVGFYDDNDTLLGAKLATKYTGDSNQLTYTYDDIPIGTSYAKAFIWEDTKKLIPLSAAQTKDIRSFTTSRSVLTLTIAPGGNETERNYAWYDVSQMDDARLQYAVKQKESDLTVFPEENAITVLAESGYVDAAKHNGKQGQDEDDIFTYDKDYSWAKATITNLAPNTEYVYRIGDKLGWCEGIYEFKTDNPDDGFEFILFSDEHAGNAGKSIIRAREKALSESPDASFIYTMGDLVDLPWYESFWTEYFNRKDMASMPLAAVSGPTHDMLNTDYTASLFGYHFNMPNRHDSLGKIDGVNSNYWFTYGDVLFIAIAHNYATTDGIKETDAFIKYAMSENPDAKWRVLCTHFPFYSYNSGGIRDARYYNLEGYGDIIADNNIDIAITGHDHTYYSSFPMYKGQAVKTNYQTQTADGEQITTVNGVGGENGAVYLSLAATGWLQDENFKSDDSYMSFADTEGIRYSNQASIYNTYYTVVSVNDNTLSFTTYKNTHEETTQEHTITETKKIETYTITK